MAGAAKLFLMAVVFLMPGGSLFLVGWAALRALREKPWTDLHRAPSSLPALPPSNPS